MGGNKIQNFAIYTVISTQVSVSIASTKFHYHTFADIEAQFPQN